MPFKSKLQMKYMFANMPKMAKEFASHMTHKEIAKLPNKRQVRAIHKAKKIS